MSAFRELVRRKGLSVKTRVRNSEGESVQMQGMPSEYTGQGLVDLAKRQKDAVKATVKPEDAPANASTTAQLLPVDAADAVAILCGEPLPNDNGDDNK